MLCRKCKKELPEESAFCCYCGVKQTPPSKAGRRGNGQGTAVKRGSTWTAIWTLGFAVQDGKLKQKRGSKGGFKTKKEALAYAANPETNVQRIPTLSEYWAVYEKTDYLDLSHSKQTAFDIAWKKLSDLAHREIGTITIGEIQDVVNRKAPTYYPAKDMKTVLSHLYKRAVAEGTARTNLADFIRLPTLEEKEQVPFSEVELRKLWDAYGAGDHVVGFVLTMIYTGMMPGELLKLTKDSINFETQQITGIGLKTKTRKENDIVFPDMLVAVLRDLCERTTSRKGYLVGMNKDKFYVEYYAALERAGTRRLTPYSCRHTTATALALGNIAPSVIQTVMRHAKFSTTQRYIHPDRSAALAAVNQMTDGKKSDDVSGSETA